MTKTKPFAGKVKQYFNIAKEEAIKSKEHFKHGAVLVKGSKKKKKGRNKNRYCSFGKQFRKEPGDATLHAELSVILGMDRNVTSGGDVYVVRINNQGDFMLSKPCSMCEAAMRKVGIKKAYYSIDNNTYGVMRLS